MVEKNIERVMQSITFSRGYKLLVFCVVAHQVVGIYLYVMRLIRTFVHGEYYVYVTKCLHVNKASIHIGLVYQSVCSRTIADRL